MDWVGWLGPRRERQSDDLRGSLAIAGALLGLGIPTEPIPIELYIQMGRYVHVSLDILAIVGLAVTFWLLFAASSDCVNHV